MALLGLKANPQAGQVKMKISVHLLRSPCTIKRIHISSMQNYFFGIFFAFRLKTFFFWPLPLRSYSSTRLKAKNLSSKRCNFSQDFQTSKQYQNLAKKQPVCNFLDLVRIWIAHGNIAIKFWILHKYWGNCVVFK